MRRDSAALRDGVFDILVVGGGIVGAGIARDAALRNLRVALVEQDDFASGTSSRSSRLIHGGLRYLEHGDIRLVRESCRERRILLQIAPHIVEPISLLFPCYPDSPRPLWKIRAGLALYDFLAGDSSIARHRIISAHEVERMEPGIRTDGMRGAGLYSDCRMDDARLCLENILDAVHAGAAAGVSAVNYCRVVEWIREGGRVIGAMCEDMETGGTIPVRARVVINATGPWADSLRRMETPAARLCVRQTQGIHLLVPRLTSCSGIAVTARRDGRLIFVLPYDHRHSMIGTTDTDFAGDPNDACVRSEDVEYLISEVNGLLRGRTLTKADVRSAFAGVRTLIQMEGNASDVSREYAIEESPGGILSVIGGKYTTYRVMARRVVDRACKRLRCQLPCVTDRPLGSAPKSSRMVYDRPEDGEEIVPGSGVIWAEVEYAIRCEMACRPMDFLRRRTGLCLTENPSREVAERLSRVFQSRLHWSDERSRRETERTMSEWAAHHPDGSY